MIVKSKAKALAIYIGESDHRNGKPLYAAIVEKAKDMGMAGATVGKAVMGFGAHSRVHSSNILLMSEDLPVIVNIVDTVEKVDAFIPVIEEMIEEGTVISWEVDVEVLRARSKD